MDKPKCFGMWWEAVPGPAGDKCRTCAIKDQCLAEFVSTTLPAAQEQLGGGTSLSALAERLEVDQQAVLLAMAHAQRPKRSKQTPVKAEKQNVKDSGNSGKKKTKKKRRKAKKKTGNGKRTWGKHTFKARWSKERERNPLIAQLTPGTGLETKYKNTAYTAIVKRGSYVFGELKFPTLSALTTHIVGSGGRNAAKFWGLKGES